VSETAVLERALRELGREVELPPEPDLAGTVARRLRAEAEPRRDAVRLPWLRRRPLALAAAVLAVALGAAFAVPQTRAAILDLLGLDGVEIERVQTLPEAPERGQQVPGGPVSLDQARAATDFELRVPDDYDAIYLDRSFEGGLVSFVSEEPRLVLTQFRGAATPYVEKSAGPGTRIEPVDVGGAIGYWLAGRRHVVVFQDASGEVRERRVAGNVLLWERGGVTYRLEGARTKTQALALANDLR
jgi:hypothetical protein